MSQIDDTHGQREFELSVQPRASRDSAVTRSQSSLATAPAGATHEPPTQTTFDNAR